MATNLLLDFESKLPDDLVEYIYTKVIYNVPKDLLEQIKYRHKIKKYINILRNINITDKYVILCDILIVYYSVINSYVKYVRYSDLNVPNNLLNDIVSTIENSKNSDKKLIDICINYLLELPFCHIKYIFKQNRPYI
tara:strand:- start:3751 stop:4161 length:411 start_codon:yes stop_codon:yes gene_type:complete